MLKDRAAVEYLLSQFERRDGGVTLVRDNFHELLLSVHLSGERPSGKLSSLRRASAHLETIWAILARYEWQRLQAQKGELSELSWMSFASLDVEQFFIAMRALFDGVAHILYEFGAKRAQTPTSFSSLYEDCRDERKLARLVALLGSDIVTLVAECSWFIQLRDTRDQFVSVLK